MNIQKNTQKVFLTHMLYEIDNHIQIVLKPKGQMRKE